MKRDITIVQMRERKYEEWEDSEWYRCSVRHLIGMLILRRVEEWGFHLHIWPPIKFLKFKKK